MTERWKTITEAPRYKVSSLGNVHSLISNKPKLAFPDHKGYLRVQLYTEPGVAITRKVHRLVAEHFIPNTLGLPQVNHIDGMKTNNRITNLEWCNQADNMRHSVENGLHEKRADIRLLAPYFKRAIELGYIVKELADNYSTTSKTIRRIVKDTDAAEDTGDLRLGSRKSYIYFDAGRGKWRTELRKFKLPNRQFDTKEEAERYVEETRR